MEEFKLHPEKFPGLFDSRGFKRGFGWVQRIHNQRVSMRVLHDLFEVFFIVCDARVDNGLCE